MTKGFVLIETKPGKEKSVIIEMLRTKTTKQMHTVFGEYDIVAFVNAEDHQALGQLVIERARIIPGVEDTMTLAACSLKDVQVVSVRERP